MAANDINMAMVNIENAVRTVKTDLNSHLGLQASLKVIKDALLEKSEPEETEGEDASPKENKEN